jgi:general nucleoside transport system permease protein
VSPVPLAWYYIYHTRPGMHLRAVDEYPVAADALGVPIYRLRYLYVFIGGLLAGLAGATISLAISPGWFSELTAAGQGWIAVGLVIFAQWDPRRAALGAYAFGTLRRLILDIQRPIVLLGLRNPFHFYINLSYFLEMLPYALTVLILVLGSREMVRKRLGAPYIRGERGPCGSGQVGATIVVDMVCSLTGGQNSLRRGYHVTHYGQVRRVGHEPCVVILVISVTNYRLPI